MNRGVYYASSSVAHPPNPNIGSSNQTEGIASRWVEPLFGQPISKTTNKPVNRGGEIMGYTPYAPQNTSEVGALGRIDSADVVRQANDMLAVAPRLPKQTSNLDKNTQNRMIIELQKQFINASMRDDNKEMRKIMERGQMIKDNMLPVKSPPAPPEIKPPPAMTLPVVTYK